MNDHHINVLNRMDEIYIKSLEDFEASLEKEYVAWEAAIEQEIHNFLGSGVLNPDFATSLPSYGEGDEETSDKEVVTTSGNNTPKEKEIVVDKKTSQRTGRITRQALREPSQLVNQQHDLVKDKVVVKVERLTNHVISKYNENAALQVKTEMDMPPPSKPIRQTKQTRKQKEDKSFKIKTELIENAQIPRDSDVIVQTDNIITLVVDTDEEEAEAPIRTTRARTKNRTKNQNKDVVVELPVTRSTRTKTRAAAMTKIEEIEMAANEQLKRLRESSPEDSGTQNKTLNKTKVRKVDDNTVAEVNTLQVPQIDIGNKIATVNETFVCNNKNKNEDQLVNTTVVIEKPRIEIPNNMKDLITDDEDESPAIARQKQKLKSKTVFSPYENSPVKKKVEAFEKLGAASAASQMPVRNLRAKGKVNDSEKGSANKSEGTAVKTRGIAKAITGSAEKYASKILTPSTNSALKPRSALKQSQTAFRERELARQQKEAEARHKKEALLRADAEEKRRKIEEKQLKAQQQRDALKKEKLKALEQSERAKQEKIKKFSADQEDKLTKKKEFNAQKYANAARKAAEEKEKQKDKVPTPKYLIYKTPLLPTADCYDSDDGDSKPIVEKEWQKKDQTTFVATLTRYTKVFNAKLFCSHSQTVDLQEIFPTIEPAKLKRTSSAIWNRSGMIKLASMMEEDDDL